MTDGDVLLACLKENPADELTRAAYADWLEEEGRDVESCLVRVSLDDREPERYDSPFARNPLYVWHCSPLTVASHLPRRMFLRLHDPCDVGPNCLYYSTREDALAALAQAIRELRDEPHSRKKSRA